MAARPDRIPLSLAPAAPLRAGAQCVVRAAICCLLSKIEKRSPADIAQERFPQQRDAIKILQRAVTVPLSSTNASAAALTALGTGALDFIQLMGGASASSALLNSGLQLTFDNAAGLPVPALRADPGNVAWLGESGAIPVRQLDTGGISLMLPYKLPVICTFTRELMERSQPNVEAVVRSVLTESVGAALDSYMLDAVAGDGVTRPAGLRAGVVALTPSTDTARFEAMSEDVGNLVAAVAPVAANGTIALVASPSQACSLRMWTQNRAEYYPILSSSGLANRVVMAVATRALVSAADVAPRFSLSSEATLHMDSAATDIGSGGIAAGGVVKSMWQTDSLALKMILEISWAMRAPGSVAHMSSVLW
jgi:hypothetical protein